MTRVEALQIADEMIADWSGQKKNERGYVHDKWQPVPLESRTRAVMTLANYLMGETTNEG